MRTKIFLGAFLSSFSLVALMAAAAPVKTRYPVVTVANGKIELMDGGKSKPLKVGDNLKEKATVRVGDKSQVRIDLSAKTSVLALENTEFQIPFIAWEDGKIEQIDLKKGRLHVVVGDGDSKTVVTALSRDFLKKGTYIYTYEPLAPQIEVMVSDGEVEFRGLENEEFVKLKSGEKAAFLGVIEAGEPVYDTLLKGRKVARGKLTKVQKMPATDLQNLKKQGEVKKVVVKKTKSVKRADDQICAGPPLGQLNECVWAYDHGAVCIRKRCNANGEWAEPTEMTKLEGRCGPQPIVLPCDY